MYCGGYRPGEGPYPR